MSSVCVCFSSKQSLISNPRFSLCCARERFIVHHKFTVPPCGVSEHYTVPHKPAQDLHILIINNNNKKRNITCKAISPCFVAAFGCVTFTHNGYHLKGFKRFFKKKLYIKRLISKMNHQHVVKDKS